jgi:hypothetical protein
VPGAVGSALHEFSSFRETGDEPLRVTLTTSRKKYFLAVRSRCPVEGVRAILYDIQRYLAEQAYYLYGPSGKVISAWEPYVKTPSCRISATTMAAG